MIKNLVSIVMPTMRPEGAVDTTRETLLTAQDHLLEFIVVTEDEATRDAVTKLLNSYDGKNLESFQVLYQKESRRPWKASNDGLRVSNGEYVALWADDLLPQPGWLTAALEAFTNFPDGIGLVGFNDLHWGDSLATRYIAHREYIIKYQNGVLAFPHYEGWIHDLEWDKRARLADRFVWVEGAVVEHLHYSFGKRPKDSFDEQSEETWGLDKAEFDRREKLGFPNDFESVI